MLIPQPLADGGHLTLSALATDKTSQVGAQPLHQHLELVFQRRQGLGNVGRILLMEGVDFLVKSE